jgi:hypothetical protein
MDFRNTPRPQVDPNSDWVMFASNVPVAGHRWWYRVLQFLRLRPKDDVFIVRMPK